MMRDSIVSQSGVPIRLTDERWDHILGQHGELADLRPDIMDAVGNPERVLDGGAGELLAVRRNERGQWLVVAYRELDGDDGFIITAFLTSRAAWLQNRRQIWP